MGTLIKILFVSANALLFALLFPLLMLNELLEESAQRNEKQEGDEHSPCDFTEIRLQGKRIG